MNTPIIAIKIDSTDVQTEFEVISAVDISKPSTKEKLEIVNGLNDVDRCLLENQTLIDNINVDIDRLTNHADGVDNMLAVGSGILTGLFDSFIVGEFEFQSAKTISHKHVNQFIEKYAYSRGYQDKGRGLKGAIEFLEKRFPVDQDNIWKGNKISSSKLHHLEDMAHHPTLLGLVSSIVVRLFRFGIFVNKDGDWHLKMIDTRPETFIRIWSPIIISALLNWLVNVAESKYTEKMGKEIPKPIHRLVKLLAYSPAVISILKVADNWCGHLVSDMGGSKNTSGGGMGIPGLFLSLLKEMSSLPLLNNTDLPQVVSDLYSKDKFDLRNELAIVEHLGKQAIPILINECIVRGFYFVRQLMAEKQKHSQWKDVNWKSTLPHNNRTITRMLTISSGTFIAVDMADAAIRSAIKSGGEPSTFFANMVLRVNFVGLGRFAIAITTDCRMGHNRKKLSEERTKIKSQMLHLYASQIFYKQANMWVAAKETEQSIHEMENMATSAIGYYMESIEKIGNATRMIVSYSEGIENKNPTLLDNISRELSL